MSCPANRVTAWAGVSWDVAGFGAPGVFASWAFINPEAAKTIDIATIDPLTSFGPIADLLNLSRAFYRLPRVSIG
jgi:hypothetical protein